jgi:hypothetical protein
VKQQEGTIRHLEKEGKATREEICKLKAGNVTSMFMEQDNSGNGGADKNSNSRPRKFSANDASQVQLNNKFSILATDVFEVGQQTPFLLNHKDGTKIIHSEERKIKERSYYWEAVIVGKLAP